MYVLVVGNGIIFKHVVLPVATDATPFTILWTSSLLGLTSPKFLFILSLTSTVYNRYESCSKSFVNRVVVISKNKNTFNLNYEVFYDFDM